MNKSRYNEDRANRIGAIEHYCGLLKGIYESLPAHSEERDALEVAAKALLFSMPQDDFHAFLSNDELTHEQKEHLARLGLDPREGEDDTK